MRDGTAATIVDDSSKDSSEDLHCPAAVFEDDSDGELHRLAAMFEDDAEEDLAPIVALEMHCQVGHFSTQNRGSSNSSDRLDVDVGS